MRSLRACVAKQKKAEDASQERRSKKTISTTVQSDGDVEEPLSKKSITLLKDIIE